MIPGCAIAEPLRNSAGRSKARWETSRKSSVNSLSFLSVLLSDEEALTPAEDCYHRLLTGADEVVTTLEDAVVQLAKRAPTLVEQVMPALYFIGVPNMLAKRNILEVHAGECGLKISARAAFLVSLPTPRWHSLILQRQMAEDTQSRGPAVSTPDFSTRSSNSLAAGVPGAFCAAIPCGVQKTLAFARRTAGRQSGPRSSLAALTKTHGEQRRLSGICRGGCPTDRAP